MSPSTTCSEQALLALQGPRAAEVLETIIPGVAELGFMEAGPFRAFGHPLWISRSGYTGEDGFEISIPAIAVRALADGWWRRAGEADRPRRPRFAPARGWASALRPRSRPTRPRR